MTTQSAPIADVRTLVDRVLLDALRERASDLHLEPQADGWEIRYRIDGMLETRQRVETTVGRAAVARLMVMGKLLTYRLDVSQEGRISFEFEGREIELRLSVMPTVHGLRTGGEDAGGISAPGDFGGARDAARGFGGAAAIRQRGVGDADPHRARRLGEDDDDLRAARADCGNSTGVERDLFGRPRRAPSSRRDTDRSFPVWAAHL